jgi:aspartate carbamoyltransferase catalytic subunit
MKTNPLFGQDILTAAQFDKESIELVMEKASEMRNIVKSQGSTDELRGKVMTALFYEPSSRTFGSFVSAIQRLGGGFIPLQGVVYSSVAKGETLEDTVSTFASYSDVVVIRHPQAGAAQIAADISDKPIINAGDGIGEHPTQALLDLFTIQDHFGNIDGLTVTLVGDLLNGRTVHSLTTMLSLYKPKAINFVSPGELKMPDELVTKVKALGIGVHETDSLDELLDSTDVLYVTRVQKERFRDLDVYERLKHRYVITSDMMTKCKKTTVLMHPFPRIGEISPDIDDDPRALYIRAQIPNGMYVRMALLHLVLSES